MQTETKPTSPSHAVSADRPLWARTLLIGTRQTLPSLAAQLKASSKGIGFAGCLVVNESERDTRRAIEWPAGLSLAVLGDLTNLAEAHRVLGITAAVVSLPESMASQRLKFTARLGELGVRTRFVQPIDDVLDESGAPMIRRSASDVSIVELIGRVPFGVDRRSVAQAITGKRVLITGAGGSIGSELARICATFSPSSLFLMERAENALFEIDRQIGTRFPGLSRRAVLHDITDADRTRRLFEDLKPQVVFHAAAHKHVPLMEDHPAHAVTNNVFGTRSVADASIAVRAERFVLVSTDKAVNPTSVMGATKRIAEMYVQSLGRAGRECPTRCAIVRFGNVLGSACSVVPIWASQLAEGGPITVTDPRMTRYFMTIHEAATLVVQSAAATATTGEAPVYVLDMGEPVKILDLATRFVRAHGFAPTLPGKTPIPGDQAPIEIAFSGARPGEKLHEELAYADEQLQSTPNPGIRAWRGCLDPNLDIQSMITELDRVRHDSSGTEVIETIAAYVPELAERRTQSYQLKKDFEAAA